MRRLERLFAYDDWANRATLASLEAAGNPPPRSRKLLAHILGAERLWHGRLRLQGRATVVWPDLDLEECRAGMADLAELWRAYLRDLAPGGLDGTVAYVNSKGESWTSRVEDVLTHVILHSSHHRGQIASDLRDAGLTPPYTDYVHAVRRGFVR